MLDNFQFQPIKGASRMLIINVCGHQYYLNLQHKDQNLVDNVLVKLLLCSRNWFSLFIWDTLII